MDRVERLNFLRRRSRELSGLGKPQNVDWPERSRPTIIFSWVAHFRGDRFNMAAGRTERAEISAIPLPQQLIPYILKRK